MRLVVQRVAQASVAVAGEVVGRCGRGLCVLVGVTHGDTEADADWLAEKTANLRIFEDDAGKMNRSLLEIGGGALVVSQFTLYGDARKGRRPSFTDAAPPAVAAPLVMRYADALRLLGVPVETGVFGAVMRVEIHNDGPVTLILERP
ncbi:MAG: D-aminoacyl-tRNA deacylase [Chloracidobacterium sp.]|nr:D-aminoacyl-tRNA deacylase [Chloracidobacterium sp.]MDW8216086.1 D-aminoacyl-tRNA deacylase [Acidobacteriota bacterium]